jgi:hypothetical protein
MEKGQSGTSASASGDFQHSNVLDMNDSIYRTLNETGHEESILSALKEKFKQARFNQLSALEFC